ncbi:hypothetical protein EX895_005883 [Sporisorium graminicola]|uniref:Mig1 protein n=1 Tax=Sporisorium graminicola TaxID=280036 RepID=A0A4U7KLH0_9BASI|nr:hypothetical protein EX895_005883 [Sporisorium graminicola]TKY84803.1 hypothetical protein EX895_005883 [Sporisorium graminicola]
MLTEQRYSTLFLALVFALIQTVLIAADGEAVCSVKPPLLPNNHLYTQHCGDNSRTLWPCFTHSSGSLYGTDILRFTPLGQFEEDGILLAKDADLVDFTPRDADRSFAINYYQVGIQLEYSPVRPGCGVLSVNKYDVNSKYRMTVTSGTEGASALGDTGDDNGAQVTTCTKMYHIRLFKE